MIFSNKYVRFSVMAVTVIALVIVAAMPVEAQIPFGFNGQPYYHQPQYIPQQKIVAQEIAVAPLIVSVPVESHAVPVAAYGPPHYYSASDAYREKAYIREVIREELRALVTSTGQPTTAAPPAPVQPTQPTATPPKTSKTAVPDDLTPPELQQKVLAAFQGKAGCVNCHAGEGAQAGFKLVLDDGRGGYRLVRFDSASRWKIYGMASVGAMPPSAVNDASKAMEQSHMPAMLQYALQKDR